MNRNWQAGLGKFALARALGGVSVPCGESAVLAQIIPDETLGAEISVVTPDNIKGLESDRISEEAICGSNLFQSFREFNIGEGRGGYFENPAAIALTTFLKDDFLVIEAMLQNITKIKYLTRKSTKNYLLFRNFRRIKISV